MRKLSTFSPSIAAKVQAFVSTEATRYYLNGFLLEPHPVKGAYIVATDGHRMGVFHDETATVAEKCIVQLSKDFVKACKNSRAAYPRTVYLDHTGKGIAYVAGALEEDAEAPADLNTLPLIDASCHGVLIDGTFPEWSRVLPKPPTVTDSHAVASFNAKYLADFGTVADGRVAIITTYSAESTAPAWVFVAGVPNFVGVLMPICGSMPDVPTWLSPSPAEAAKAAAE